MELMDWMVTPVGVDLRSWGIEKQHYDITGTRPAAYTDYTQTRSGQGAGSGNARKITQATFDQYKTKSDPFRTFQGETGVGQLDFAVIWDDEVIYTWDAPGEQDSWYAMSVADKSSASRADAARHRPAEQDKIKKIIVDVNAILDPAIDKVVLGQATLADYDKAVADAIKVGAQDLEKIYADAEARA